MSNVRRASRRYNVGNNLPAEAAPGKGSTIVISSISPILGTSIWNTRSACGLATCFHMLHPDSLSARLRGAHTTRGAVRHNSILEHLIHVSSERDAATRTLCRDETKDMRG